MNKNNNQIDLIKLALYILKRCWLIVLCAAIGFGFLYWRYSQNQTDTYTTSCTVLVFNGNPNQINYSYASTGDLYAANQLVDTYRVVIRSNQVMDKIAARLLQSENGERYQGISTAYLAGTISMAAVEDTGVVRISVTTNEAQKSLDICNAVYLEAPDAIKKVVEMGVISPMDPPYLPLAPNPHNTMRRSMRGAE